MTVTTIFKKSNDELSKAAVNILVEVVNKLLQRQKQVVLAIPGGRSVAAIWKLLASDHRIPWRKIQVLMADERVVPITSGQSNYRLAYDTFLKKLIEAGELPEENLHPFIADKGSSNYNKKLKKYGGKPDIIILSIGEDGHVGALYPNHHSVKDSSEGYIAVDDSPKPPLERITMSRKTMLKAKTALLLFIGEAKREAYEKFKAGDDIIECPARLAKQIKDSYVLTDLK